MKIKVSKMSGKLKDIEAINSNPLSNLFCQSMNASGKKDCICTHCYSCSMLKAYRRNCVPAFEMNSKVLSQGKLELNDMPRFSKKNNIIRLHAHGELINDTHLLNLIDIVISNPTKTFSLYTKRADLIDKVFTNLAKPDNLILVYSNPTIDTPITTIPRHFDKVFNVYQNKYQDKINCGSKNCNGCRNCYDKNKVNIIYEAIKR